MFDTPIFSTASKIIKEPDFAISYDQAMELAQLPESQTMDLLAFANKIREHYKGRKVFTCSITNAKSGRCSENCAFCAQSAHHNTHIKTYDLLPEDTFADQAAAFQKQGATQYSMVTSGQNPSHAEIQTICSATAKIAASTHMTTCASLGMLDDAKAQMLSQSGVKRYHHNLETARSYFDQICTTHKYDDNIGTIRAARQAGMHICSGGIFGLGETWAQRLELAFTLKELDVDSVPINFLNPIQGTRLQDRPLLSPIEALKSIALVRFILPDKDITICGGREITLKDFQSWVFFAGANGLMIGNYLTTQGRSIDTDIDMIRELGFTIEPAV